MRGALALAFVVGGAATVAQQPPAPPGSSTFQRLIVDLPLTPLTLQGTILMHSVRSRTPVGIEIVRQSVDRPRDHRSVEPAIVKALDLTGLGMTEILEHITAHEVQGPVPRYEWWRDEVFALRPAHFRTSRSATLNRVISRLESERENLMDTLYDILRTVDPKQPTKANLTRMPNRIRTFVERPIRVSAANETLRSVLNRVANQHGGMSWLVEYSDVSGGSRGMKLTFIGFDQWQLSSTTSR
jgi:hypothetical protein